MTSVSAIRGQPAQRAAQHGPENRGRQTAVAAQCCSAWVDRRNGRRNLEDAEDYKAFEAAIIADYCAETAVARELVLRLASLLWRLRRATAIETDLLALEAEREAERQTGEALIRRGSPEDVVRPFRGRNALSLLQRTFGPPVDTQNGDGGSQHASAALDQADADLESTYWANEAYKISGQLSSIARRLIAESRRRFKDAVILTLVRQLVRMLDKSVASQ